MAPTLAWLEAIDQLLAAHVVAVRDRWAADASRRVHDVVDDIVVAQAGSRPGYIANAADAARAAIAADERWPWLVATLGVGPREIEWMALLAACELNPRLARVLGYLDDTAAATPPSPAIAAVVWGWPLGYQPGPASAVAQWQLGAPDGGWQATTPWTIDCGVAAYLGRLDDWSHLRNEATLIDASSCECLFPTLLNEMTDAVRDITSVGCEVELVGAVGSGRRTLLAQLGTALGRRVALMSADAGMRALASARLLDAVPLWVTDGAQPVGVDAAAGGLTFVARTAASTARPDGFVRLSWTLPVATADQRERLWAGVTRAPWPRMVSDWEFTAADVLTGAAAADAGQAVASRVLRNRLRRDTSTAMSRVELPYDWHDLVVADHVRAALRRLHDEVSLRRDVLDDWEFRRLCPATPGVTALFAGPSGTGKTMAAQVLARSLQLDLFRVDLATVVSKYVGETEKQLAAVFDEAERSNVLIFFDEADALFGQRTRVHDAHDRYANIEIDYLLQRLDTFRGISILATNRKSDLDAAFLRRLRTIVDFVAPAANERLQLWQLALPSHTSTGHQITDDLDHQWLADHLELTGADIKSIALSAAYDARSAGELISTGSVLEASRRELSKRGAVLRLEHPLAVAQ